MKTKTKLLILETIIVAILMIATVITYAWFTANEGLQTSATPVVAVNRTDATAIEISPNMSESGVLVPVGYATDPDEVDVIAIEITVIWDWDGSDGETGILSVKLTSLLFGGDDAKDILGLGGGELFTISIDGNLVSTATTADSFVGAEYGITAGVPVAVTISVTVDAAEDKEPREEGLLLSLRFSVEE